MATALAPNHATGAAVNTPPAQNGIVDPPMGPEIRRQVEYYFSDENLPTDLHLLECCQGRKNEPVSISRISNWGKMKAFKPKSNIVAALRFSTSLELTPDEKRVFRKVPFVGLCALDDEFHNSEDDIAHDPTTEESGVQKEPPKKKRSKRPATKRSHNQVKQPKNNMDKPSGFEKTYIEPPIKPTEAADDKKLYDPDARFIDRIESAIHTFKEKRRMHEMYAHVFNKLMRFGGVESTPRLFQGVTEEDRKHWDAEERVRNMANHKVPEDRADEDKWVVDFPALAKAFLSSWYPAHYGYTPNAVKNACQVPRSFYNYLRYHSVCPEYDEQLVEALKTCDLAETELPKVHEVGLALPGDFSKSASAIHGGAYSGLYAGDQSWAEEMKKEGIDVDKVGIRDEEANIKFRTGVAIMGSDEQYDKLEKKCLNILEHAPASLEVVNIQLPTEEAREMYREQDKVSSQKVGPIEPLGKLTCTTWIAEDCDEWDLPKDKYPTGRPHQASTDQTYEFWVEESILKTCFKGLKIDAKVLQLEGGITILDEVHETMCSFFTWLPNELWMDKKPKEVKWIAKRLPGSHEVEDEDEEDQPATPIDSTWPDAAEGHQGRVEGKGDEEGTAKGGDEEEGCDTFDNESGDDVDFDQVI